MIRKYRPSDLETLRQITAICFEGVSIDKNIEDKFGIINELDWKQRKMPHINDDVEANADGVFVAEIDGEVAGYITAYVNKNWRHSKPVCAPELPTARVGNRID